MGSHPGAAADDPDRTTARPPSCLACHDATPGSWQATVEPGFRIRTCPACGLGQTWPPLSAGEVGGWYPEQYYGRENVRFNPLFERLVRWFRRRRATAIRRLVSPGPVLEVGCGRGLLLHHLRAMGFEPHGIELSSTAAWHAREVLGIPVTIADFAALPRETERYRAIIFWHSLEHLADPGAALAWARQALEPGGLLVVAVPNFGSLEARLLGRHWFHLDVPRHGVHFSAHALALLLTRHGFHAVKVDHFSLEQNPYGLLQSLYNALGFRFNLLYSLLKDRSAGGRGLGEIFGQAVAIAALLPVLLPLALALTLGETALRAAGTVEVYAVKR